jgi:hypothetical protein
MAFDRLRRKTAMAIFRVSKPQEPKPESPVQLFRDLPKDSTTIKFLWGHQEKLLDKYHQSLLDKKDVAVELPTGSGKTLVGMLMGEYRRRAFGERVAFLCPNKQLCCQVETQAKKYGIATSLLIGPQKDYDPIAFSKYQQGKAIAVSTYSGVFNANPKISDPQTLICDDAHAADGFVASMWTFRVERHTYDDFFLRLYYAFRPAVPRWLAHAIESYDGNPHDRGALDLATMILAADCCDDVRAVVKEAMPDADELKYPWENVAQHLESSLILCTPHIIEIRPVIPPTMTHLPFAGANQRIYMSATLGEDGGIERSFGVGKIERLPIPEGWDKKGTGRRLILFPLLSGRSHPTEVLQGVIERSERSLVLVPSEAVRTKISKYLPSGFTVLGPQDVEKDMSAFTQKQKAILLLANRYDGIDLPGSDCRMLVIAGCPTGATLLERYYLDRLGATSVLRDRLRTRITQAMGRCTRDEGDYSVVVLMGEDLLDWSSTATNVTGMHPELQGEISFGLENSENRSKEDVAELCSAFLDRTADWQAAEQDIQARRNSAHKLKDEITDVLARSAPLEIDHCKASWSGRHEEAFNLAVQVTEQLEGGSDMLPYRSFWYHQAAVSAYLAHRQSGKESFKQAAVDLLGRASATSHGVRWLPDVQGKLGGKPASTLVLPEQDWFLVLKRLLENLGRIGTRCKKALAENANLIRAKDSKQFEQGLEMLGRLLGAEAKRFTEDGAPDGFWLFGDWHAFVFEAKTDEGEDGGISLNTVRQAATHEQAVRSKKLLPEYVPCSTVIISPRKAIAALAVASAGDLFYVPHAEIISLYDAASKAFEEVRAASGGNTDEVLRERFLQHYKHRKLSMQAVATLLQKKRLDSLPVKK